MSVLRALGTTLRYFLRRAPDRTYPRVRPELSDRFRGVLSLTGMIGEGGDKPVPDQMAPCTGGCPAHVNARGYIQLTALGMYYEAYLLHLESNPMPATFGRICSHPCEDVCRRGEEDQPLSIRCIKRYMADKALEQILSGERPDPHKPHPSPNGIKIAVVGSGPAGLSCAYYLAKLGYSPVIFEKDDTPGGMLAHGIPIHRLPRKVLKTEIDLIRQNGVEIRTGIGMGEDVTIKELSEQGFKAFFISAGLSSSKMLSLEGNELEGIYPATEVLRKINEGEELELGNNLIVIGAGNVAMDVTQCLCRLGKNVSVACRSPREKLSAFPEEIEDAEIVGAQFKYKIEPERYLGENGKVTGVEFKPVVRRDAGTGSAALAGSARGAEPSAPISPSDAQGEDHTSMTCDGVIVAIGQFADIGFLAEAGVEFTPRGLVKANPVTCQTSIPNIFAGGDVVTGPSSAISGVGSGHAAAISIDKFIRGEALPERMFEPPRELVAKHRFNWLARLEPETISISSRSSTFNEVERPFSLEEVTLESERCLSCNSNKCVGCQICEKNCPDGCIYIRVNQDGQEVALNLHGPDRFVNTADDSETGGQAVLDTGQTTFLGTGPLAERLGNAPPKERDIHQFDIEISACSFCGICSEMCPTKCLRHTKLYGFSTENKQDLVFDKTRLLDLGKQV